ncbi:MAG: hypothetical protein KIS91_16930 [Anaerolineae bacterium]|nr:hypothetical protein [Anaerolineae bacterium]
MSRHPADVIEIRDAAADVEALMTLIRDRAAQRRDRADTSLDLDATTRAVFAAAGVAPAADIDASLTAALPTPPPPGQETLPALRDLNAQWMIREQPFTSNTPLIGPLIVKVRDAWNWMSTKWYVRPLLQQITAFNLSAVRAFRDVEAEQGRVADRLRELEALTRQQAAEIEALRHDVQRLRAERHTDTQPPDPGARS